MNKTWTVREFQSIEDLKLPIPDADLVVTQVDPSPFRGRRRYAQLETGITVLDTLVRNRSRNTGLLSKSSHIVGVALQIGEGTRHWLNETAVPGSFALYPPGSLTDTLYGPDTRIITFVIPPGSLRHLSRYPELSNALKSSNRRGIHPRSLETSTVQDLAGPDVLPSDMVRTALSGIAAILGQDNSPLCPGGLSRSTEQIVLMARRHISSHLDEPLRNADIARAVNTSERSLYRAFVHHMGETPQSHVRRIRLHRIRNTLSLPKEKYKTIQSLAWKTGFPDPERMTRAYSALFGELPSDTARSRRRRSD